MTTSPEPPERGADAGDDVLGTLAAETGALAGDPLVSGAAPASEATDVDDHAGHDHAGHDHGPTADVSVRPAIPEDDALVTTVQLQAWQRRELITSEQLAAVDTEAVRTQWRTSITTPPSSQHRVLAACEGSLVVGFAAFGPAGEVDLPVAGPGTVDDAVEILALEVVADHSRQGHGSRLLAACADLAVELAASALLTWCTATDDARTRFLDSAGFAPAGLRRRLDTPNGTIVEHCWFARI